MSQEYYARAMMAYIRVEKAAHGLYQQPSQQLSGVELHDGLQYVVLRNVNGLLAVYRIRPDNGVIRRLKRWPAELGKY